MKWEDSQYADDMQVILDMATGADGGICFLKLRTFLIECETKGDDVPFVRQFAALCRILELE